MKCENALEILESHRYEQDSVDYRRAEKHLGECERCRHASHALEVLRAERHRPVPKPPDGLVRAVRAATEQTPRTSSTRRGFWAGLAVGGALAAGIALAVVLVWPVARTPEPFTQPIVTAALGEVRSVDLELASPRRLENAEIRLELDGAVELDGYAGRRELSWRTDLDAGTNRLTLPLILRGPEGGELRVVVRTGEQARSFRFDVRAGDEAAGAPVGRRDGTDEAPGRV